MISYPLDNNERAHLEDWADALEAMARDQIVRALIGDKIMQRNELFGIANDVKQIARLDTPSFGV